VYTKLCRRVEALLAAAPSAAAVHEAAYWRITCERLRSASSRPTSAPASAAHRVGLLQAYRQYVERYPASRYVPRMVALLFEDAEQRGDRGTMRALLEQLRRDFADDAVTALLSSRWERIQCIGRPFPPWRFQSTAGAQHDTAAEVGHVVLIVVWAGYDQAARERVSEVEAFRRQHPEVRVLGVSLDETPDATAIAAQALQVDWPQFNDGRGWGNAFVRAWGVRELPTVFVLDRAGRLLGVAADGRWRSLAGRAVSGRAGGAASPD
jgi:hypothetical protein